MAGLLDPSHLGITTNGAPTSGHGKLEEPDHSSSNWYFTREEIEKNSPSRKDGIDLKKETYFRKSYCTFLQDLGMRLKVPQVTIATAIIFCHRFFHRQSHMKNDRYVPIIWEKNNSHLRPTSCALFSIGPFVLFFIGSVLWKSAWKYCIITL